MIADTLIGARMAVERLAQRRWGKQCRVTGYRMLTRRAALVARIQLDGAPVATAIVKHLEAPMELFADILADHPEFANELLNHRFLARAGLGGALTPELFADDPGGMLLFADLGDADAILPRGFDELIPALATALAALHGTTRSLADDYAALRMEMELGDARDDRRKYGLPGMMRLYQAGTARCLAMEGMGFRTMAALARELEQVEQMISDPGEFRALIHDDLSNARQTFDTGDRLALLDWEQAKYGHALLDFVKPMVGKFEIELETGISAWQCPCFPIALPHDYRRQLARDYGMAFDDAEWNANLSAALIFGSLALIGRMMAWDSRRSLRGSPLQNINGISRRLAELLADNPEFPALRSFLRDYLVSLTNPLGVNGA